MSELTCPKCGSTRIVKLGPLSWVGGGVFGGIASAVLGLGCLPLLFLAPVFLVGMLLIAPFTIGLKRCKDCGKMWKPS